MSDRLPRFLHSETPPFLTFKLENVLCRWQDWGVWAALLSWEVTGNATNEGSCCPLVDTCGSAGG